VRSPIARTRNGKPAHTAQVAAPIIKPVAIAARRENTARGEHSSPPAST
jgi:hypothetical protein